MEFANVLEEVVQPIYLSAKNCGFRNWYKVHAAKIKVDTKW